MFPNRVSRVAENVQDVLSSIILEEVKDPGMPEVFTITRVEMTRDLRIARVHFSQLPDDEESVASTVAALGRARGFLRRELGARMPLKYLPSLEFFFDPSPAHAQRIEQILHSLRPDDHPDVSPGSDKE